MTVQLTPDEQDAREWEEWEREQAERRRNKCMNEAIDRYMREKAETEQPQTNKGSTMSKSNTKQLFTTVCDERQPTPTREDAAMQLGAAIVENMKNSEYSTDQRQGKVTNARSLGFQLIGAFVTNSQTMRDQLEPTIRKFVR